MAAIAAMIKTSRMMGTRRERGVVGAGVVGAASSGALKRSCEVRPSLGGGGAMGVGGALCRWDGMKSSSEMEGSGTPRPGS